MLNKHIVTFIFSSAIVSTLQADPVLQVGEEITEDNDGLLFLRESEVILKPRELQLSVGFNYSTNENFINLRRSNKRFASFPVGLSYGVSKRFSVNASLPLIYNDYEIIAANNVVDSNVSGVGEMSLGALYKIKLESTNSPALTFSSNVSIPTEKTAETDDPKNSSLGSGFLSTSVGLGVSKSIDPAVLFFNIGYQHTFDDIQNGINIQPGAAITYTVGAGMAINRSISFSGRVSGRYQKETKSSDIKVSGTSSEPVSFIGTVDYRLNDKTRLETSFDFGLTDTANDMGLGLTLVRNL